MDDKQRVGGRVKDCHCKKAYRSISVIELLLGIVALDAGTAMKYATANFSG
jgi:hypothetical protein